MRVGQKVVVIKAHANGADLPGTVVRACSADSSYKGKWWIELEGNEGMLPVEPERLVDSNAYYARIRARYAHPPKS
jgi:hypothetical protein